MGLPPSGDKPAATPKADCRLPHLIAGLIQQASQSGLGTKLAHDGLGGVHVGKNSMKSAKRKHKKCLDDGDLPHDYGGNSFWGDTMAAETVGNRIAALRKKLRLSQAQLGERVGVAQRTVSLWENSDSIKIENIEKLCEALRTNEQYLRFGVEDGAARPVPLRGRVGAGEIVTMLPDEAIDYVDAPPNAEGIFEALEVTGNSMSPAFRHGHIVYYRVDVPYKPADLIGESCVVQTSTGEVYLKRIFHGSQPGVYTLVSFSGEPINEVTIVRCAPVEWVKFRR